MCVCVVCLEVVGFLLLFLFGSESELGIIQIHGTVVTETEYVITFNGLLKLIPAGLDVAAATRLVYTGFVSQYQLHPRASFQRFKD